MMGRIRELGGVIYESVKRTGILILIGCLIAASVESLRLLGEGRQAVAHVKDAAWNWKDYSFTLTNQLKSERNQKAIDAGIAAAGTFQATGKLINTQTIPRLNKSIDQLGVSLEKIGLLVGDAQTNITSGLVVDLRALVKDSNQRLNGDGGLMAEITVSVAAVRLPVERISPKLELLASEGLISLQKVNDLLAADEWKKLLAEATRATGNAADITANLDNLTATIAKEAPTLFDMLERFARTSNKYQAVLLLARIFSYLALPLVP
jgi:hypothetical protein